MGTLTPRQALGNNTVADKLQKLFQSQNIPADMETGRGLETLSIFSLDEQGNPQERNPFSGWTEIDDAERKNRMRQILDAAAAGNLMAFQPGQEQPVNIRIREDKVSVSRNTGRKEPEKPGLFKRMMHSMNSSWFKEDFDRYEAGRRSFELARKKLDYFGKPEVISAHQERARKAVQQRGDSGIERERFLVEQNKVQTKLEQVFGDMKNQPVDQLITIDGKTLAMCMRARKEKQLGEKTPMKSADLTALRRDGHQNAAEYVTAALLAGKHVELHVPDSFETLKKPPVVLKAADVGLSSAKTVEQLGKERCDTLALNENIDNADRYRRIDETRMLVEKKFFLMGMQKHTSFQDPIRGQFTDSWLDAHSDILTKQEGSRLSRLPSEVHGFSLERGCVGSHAIGMMMAEGKKLEDILDPDKLKTEKADAGTRFLNAVISNKDPETGRYNGDPDKLAEMNVTGRLALKNYLDQSLREIDLTKDSEIFSDKFRLIATAAQTLFDLDQESVHLKEPIERFLSQKYPGKENKVKEELSFAACGMGGSVKQLNQCHEAMVDCALGNKEEASTCSNALFGFFLGQKLTDMVKENPDKAPTMLIDSTTNMDIVNCTCSARMGKSPTLKNAGRLVTGEQIAGFGRSALFGEIRKNLVFTKETDGIIAADIRQEREAALKTEAVKQAEKNIVQPAPQKAAPVMNNPKI